MEKRITYSKEIKIKACKDYENGAFSFMDVARTIGVSRGTVHRWYARYREHGSNAFKTLNKKRSYSKEFKLSVVEEYNTGQYSMMGLAAKHNTSDSVIKSWIDKCYNGIEITDYDPKGEVYTMKSRKTTFKERIEIVKWVIENNMDYKDAAAKYSITYALVYKWTKAYIDNGPEALQYKKRGPKSKSEIDKNDLTEVEKLKLELEKERALRKRGEFELEVLKKKEELEKQLHSRK